MVREVFTQLPIPNINFIRSINLTRPTKPPLLAFRSVLSKDGFGVYASSDKLFKGAVFGRDSLEVAEDLMHLKPRLVQNILVALAGLQGEHQNNTNEEEPGKIIHEYRRTLVDGKPLAQMQREIFEKLGSKWGGNKDFLAYYGSIDATPLFIRVVGEYCSDNGNGILARQVTLQSGRTVSMADVLENAVNWLIDHLDHSSTGLVEYCRQNPNGIENQVWKDSKEFYVHKDGQIVRHTKPVASIEVQAIAYDALALMADIFTERSEELKKCAEKIQQRTLELLWQPERAYFGLGVDSDDHGRPRVIQTVTANPAEILDSRFLEDLPEEDKQMCITGVIENIMGPDFLTDAGIRSRGLSEANLAPFWDYHGSFTSWPKETYDIAKGLRRQGFPKLAKELENRLLNIVRVSGTYPEFIYVDARGRVLGTSSSPHREGELLTIDSTNEPERVQAWTVSAIIAINASRRKIVTLFDAEEVQQPWQSELEKRILSSMPRVSHLKSRSELAARYPSYPYELKKRS